MKRLSGCIFFIFCLPLLCFSQQDDPPTFKYFFPDNYWSFLRGDVYLKDGSFIYLENNLVFNKYKGIGSGIFENLQHHQYVLGLQYCGGQHWYMGAKQTFLSNPDVTYITELNALHAGSILQKVDFIQQLSFEYISPPKSDNPHVIIRNEGRLSLLLMLHKEFNLLNRPLKIHLFARPYLKFYFGENTSNIYQERFIDRTRFGMYATYGVFKNVHIGAFAFRETDYYYRKGMSPEGRLNQITPQYGFILNVVINNKNRQNPLLGMPLF
ncbi:MAG: hypothetical protein ACK40G_04275 [Cytophagaceae bacterium]